MRRRRRRHHNNDGRRQVRTGATRRQVESMARRLGVPLARTAFAPGDALAKDVLEVIQTVRVSGPVTIRIIRCHCPPGPWPCECEGEIR